ncbi:MAG: N-methyl-L-tryptophan oxidase [Acidobacteria bacterium]|nr:N-methyl-L-tryptophan oxidase [Acidobacteriota bacterium]MCW5969383.1 N-methyl-L-tryptophan oxidase [Blastocatellales bacterium]
MRDPVDVIIIGLGAMGSAAAYHLARRGQRVLGIDRFAPPHAFGSSHGGSRIIRTAYFEDPCYVPLARRAFDLWLELEAASDDRLFERTGCINIGAEDSAVVAGALTSALQHDIAHEMLDAAELRRRFPVFNIDDETVALLEPGAGVLFPERCIDAHLKGAQAAGAECVFNDTVTAWEPDSDGVCVKTAKSEYRAGRLIVAAGAWTGNVIQNLPLRVERQVVCWFSPDDPADRFAPSRLPAWVWEHDPGHFIYGFPDFGEGAKFARHHDGKFVDPDAVDRDAAPEEIDDFARLARAYVRGLAARPHASSVCLYSNTPDFHFLIDEHPHYPQVIVASPCSGHGFKFASAIGESLAAWIVDGAPVIDMGAFRFQGGER